MSVLEREKTCQFLEREKMCQLSWKSVVEDVEQSPWEPSYKYKLAELDTESRYLYLPCNQVQYIFNICESVDFLGVKTWTLFITINNSNVPNTILADSIWKTFDSKFAKRKTNYFMK